MCQAKKQKRFHYPWVVSRAAGMRCKYTLGSPNVKRDEYAAATRKDLREHEKENHTRMPPHVTR